MTQTQVFSLVIALVAVAVLGASPVAALQDVTLTFSVQPASSGVVLLDPPSGSYPPGTVVTLTPFPLAGFEFSSWTGDLTGAQAPATLTMDTSKTVTAVFTALPPPTTYELNISTSGFGSVALNPPGGFYAEGTVVELMPFAFPGFEFSDWDGDLSGHDSPEYLVIDEDKQVTAVFVPSTPPSFEISVSVEPPSECSVVLTPPQGPYLQGTSVILTPVPGPGYEFDSWEGDLEGSVQQQKIVMNRDWGVVANFVWNGATTVEGGVSASIPLLASAPNPFRGQTVVRYSLERRGVVRLVIYDVSGRLVRMLMHAVVEPGEHAVAWNGLDAVGRRSVPGVYFVQLESGEGHRATRLVRLQ